MGRGNDVPAEQVGLVEQHKQPLPGSNAGSDGGEGVPEGPGPGGVEHQEDEGGFREGGVGAVDADGLDGVAGFADAGGVDEAEGDAGDVDGVLDGVSGGAGDVGDYGAVLAEQGVEQGALAGVDGSDDGDGDAVLDRIAEGK